MILLKDREVNKLEIDTHHGAPRPFGFFSTITGLNIGFVGIRERLIAGNRTGKAVASFPSLVSLWQEENLTLGTHPVILTSSGICINDTSTRQWPFCHLTSYNKRQPIGVKEANYSTLKISRRAKSRLLDCRSEKRGTQSRRIQERLMVKFPHSPYYCKTNLFSQWKCIVIVIVFSI